MLRLKGCPKCKGAVLTDRDVYGWYELCIQCGYQRDLQNLKEVPKGAGAGAGVIKKSGR